MANKHEVLNVFDRNPQLSSSEIAERVGCKPEYVRATLQRNGRTLHRSPGNASPLQLRETAKSLRDKAAVLEARADAIEAPDA